MRPNSIPLFFIFSTFIHPSTSVFHPFPFYLSLSASLLFHYCTFYSGFLGSSDHQHMHVLVISHLILAAGSCGPRRPHQMGQTGPPFLASAPLSGPAARICDVGRRDDSQDSVGAAQPQQQPSKMKKQKSIRRIHPMTSFSQSTWARCNSVCDGRAVRFPNLSITCDSWASECMCYDVTCSGR